MSVTIPRSLVDQLADRMLKRLGFLAGLRIVGTRAARPHPLWAAAGAIWAVHELVTMQDELDVSRMEANIRDDVWDAADMTVFARIFETARAQFRTTTTGIAATRQNHKLILIPQHLMPMIAQVDTVGMARFGQQLVYDRAGRLTRRRAATAGRGRAGWIALGNGVSVPGSWEEYPFAVTYAPGRPGSHIGRVPLAENWSQGGLIAAAKLIQNIVDGNQVHAYVV